MVDDATIDEIIFALAFPFSQSDVIASRCDGSSTRPDHVAIDKCNEDLNENVRSFYCFAYSSSFLMSQCEERKKICARMHSNQWFDALALAFALEIIYRSYAHTRNFEEEEKK